MRNHRLMKPDKLCDPHLNRRDPAGTDMFGNQDGETGHQFGTHHLADDRMIMQPVEYALRIQLSVIWIADMKDVFPWDEDVIEHRQIIELITRRRQRMLNGIVLHSAFTS